MTLLALNLTAALRHCVVNAIHRSQALMDRLLQATHRALVLKGESDREPRQHLIADSLRLLEQHRPALIEAYPETLLGQFAARQTEATGWAAPDPDGPVQFLMLVKERTESSDIRQSVLRDTQTELAELDALVSAAQGLPDVQSGHNPLRPGNYVRALQQALEDTGVSTQVRQIWMQQMSEFLGVLLAQEYRDASHDLYAQGVQPLDYTVLAAPLQSAERERERERERE
ncbi:DUF1631 domain-containing protein [Verminephrobacter eiseniae]|uniref:DUF1631 domain-containing protein n=1 Tax=Verminephrobacter eiseniae TaxID=364317 RepID=UPI002237542E|nr:DUF1631 domain-containing protein [Verminephrobacter eiseniae]MCW5238833.1 DUF1631 family protein [Verminephrobacter eiseniae]